MAKITKETITKEHISSSEVETTSELRNSQEEMRQSIESQLHEQYAINNNSNLNSVVVLLAAMIAVFWGYAYMFIHSSVEFSCIAQGWCLFNNCTGLYSLDAFLLSALASCIVLHIMRRICIYQGYAQRYEQFITFAIRHKYFAKLFYHRAKEVAKTEEIGKQEMGIFPKWYHPFNKDNSDKRAEKSCACFANPLKCKHNFIQPIQGLFGEFVKVFCLLQIILILGVVVKILMNVLTHHTNGYSIIGIVEIIILFISIVILSLYDRFYLCKKHCKYKDLEREYQSINPNN